MIIWQINNPCQFDRIGSLSKALSKKRPKTMAKLKERKIETPPRRGTGFL